MRLPIQLRGCETVCVGVRESLCVFVSAQVRESV